MPLSFCVLALVLVFKLTPFSMQEEDVQKIFDGQIFGFDGSVSQNEKQAFGKKIVERGGKVYKAKIPDNTFCVLYAGSSPTSKSVIKRCKEKAVPLVSLSWVDEAISRGEASLPAERFQIQEEEPEEREEEEEEEEDRGQINLESNCLRFFVQRMR